MLSHENKSKPHIIYGLNSLWLSLKLSDCSLKSRTLHEYHKRKYLKIINLIQVLCFKSEHNTKEKLSKIEVAKK